VKTKLTVASLICAALWLLSTFVQAQSFTGAIVGTVKNASGEVIANAEVVITQIQTNKQVHVVTNGEGYYNSTPLAVGEYRIEAKMTGFRRAVHNNLTLQIQQTLTLDFTLEVGQVAETVEVTTQAPLLETTTSSLGKVVDNKRILELPLNTRNVYSLIFLTPGVSGSIGNNYNSLSYSVNGARPTMMDTVIDGVTASFPTVNGFTGISIFPSVDAIQEFKVMGATYPAEFGRSLGSVLNVVFKSGTNQLHGSAVCSSAQLGFRRQRLLPEQSGPPARQLQTQPIRRRRHRADQTRQDLFYGVRMKACARAPLPLDTHCADGWNSATAISRRPSTRRAR
jgi:hypothetical protein